MLKCLEGYKEFHLPDNYDEKKEPGWSAMMRLKNEEEFIVPCLLSVKDLFTEFIIILNQVTDRTRELIDLLQLPNILIYEYPFAVVPSGPRQVDVPIHSVFSEIHHYRWSVSKVNYNFMTRWDGDHIAMSSFCETQKLVKSDKYDVIWDTAWDLVGDKADMLGMQQQVAQEPRTHRLNGMIKTGFNPTKYTHGTTFITPQRMYQIKEPDFLHMKWCKKNPYHHWVDKFGDEAKKIDHYEKIADRHRAVTRYNGMYPLVLSDYYRLGKDPMALIELYQTDTTRDARLPVRMEVG